MIPGTGHERQQPRSLRFDMADFNTMTQALVNMESGDMFIPEVGLDQPGSPFQEKKVSNTLDIRRLVYYYSPHENGNKRKNHPGSVWAHS